MDWLILIFLLPLVFIPLVFLMGFVGCGFSPRASPSAPSNLVATAISPTEIDLTWTDNEAVSSTAFIITRSEDGAPALDPTTAANPSHARGNAAAME